jgi:uncharacterized membrane protein
MQDIPAPLFAAVLTPPRRMSPRAIAVVVGLVLVLMTLPGLIMFSVGALPIAGLMGLDFVAIVLVLRLSQRAGKRREEVTLWPGRLEIVFVGPKGELSKANFRPTAVRLVIERDFDERTTALRLKSGETETQVGAFLSSDEKASFGKAFGTALRQARAESVTSKPGRPR